jgi:3-oxoadipate enol-lactonase
MIRYATAAEGVKLAYRIDDHTDSWLDAPYLLLLHGYGRSSTFWYQWIPYLSRHYRILRPDMRGFGRSREGFSLAGKFSLEVFVEDIVSVLDDIGCDRVHFCGEAFGGTLGMQFAASHPDRVRTLSLVSSPVVLSKQIRGIYKLDGDSWEDAIRKRGVKAWVESTNTAVRFAPWMPKGFFDWYSTELGKTDAETLIAFSKLCEDYDQRRFLPKITCPVFGIYPSARKEATDHLQAAGMADLTLQILQSDYMLINFIYPRETAQAVLNFVAQQDQCVLLP